MDRLLAVVFFVFIVLLAMGGYMTRFFAVIPFAVVLTIWGLMGFKNLPIGWRGQLLCFGQRQDYFVAEGVHWTPWPFGFQTADCRDQITKLDKTTVFTADGAEVEIKEISIVWKILDLSLFFNLKPDELARLLDDVVDKDVKAKIKTGGVRDVITMELGIEQVEVREDLAQWGMQISRVIVPESAEPTDPKLKSAIQLEVAERFEQVGETVEIKHIIARVAEMVLAGYSHEEAVEQVQITTHGTEKKIDVQKIMLEPSSLAMLATLLGGNKK